MAADLCYLVKADECLVITVTCTCRLNRKHLIIQRALHGNASRFYFHPPVRINFKATPPQITAKADDKMPLVLKLLMK